jgi:hypothetical protein
MIARQTVRIRSDLKPRVSKLEYKEDPIMMDTMKLEKVKPRGGFPPSSTGVHKNTKMYMHDSKID